MNARLPYSPFDVLTALFAALVFALLAAVAITLGPIAALADGVVWICRRTRSRRCRRCLPRRIR